VVNTQKKQQSSWLDINFNKNLTFLESIVQRSDSLSFCLNSSVIRSKKLLFDQNESALKEQIIIYLFIISNFTRIFALSTRNIA